MFFCFRWKKKFSFFEVEKGVAEKLQKALNGEVFEGVTISVEASQERPKVSSYDKKRSKSYGNSRGGRRKDRNRRGGSNGGRRNYRKD